MKLQAVPERPRRAVAYLRQSLETEETISDAIQRTACEDYAARNGIDIVAEVWEQHSGRIWHKRAGVAKAMGMVESGDADVILLWKWSRLSRRKLHWAIAEEKVEQLGGTIESATEQVDLTTASGRFSRNVLIDLAEMESDRIGEAWRETHDNRRARGLPASGGARYGYRRQRDPERYVIHESEAEVLRWVVAEYIAGHGWPHIVRELNAKGVTNAQGRPWRSLTLTGVCDSGFLAGLLNRTVVVDGLQQHQPLDRRAWDSGAHEAIIDTATWQRYLRARRARPQTPARTIGPAHPLSGLIKCGDCGYSMTRRPHKVTVQFYCQQWTATKAVRCVTVAESRVHREVMAFLQDVAEGVDSAARDAKVAESRVKVRTDAQITARQIVELDKQLATLTRQLVAGIVPESAYVAARDELTAEKGTLERQLAAVEATRRVSPRKTAASLLADWDVLPVVRRRDLLKTLIDRVEVYPPEKKGFRGRIEVVPTW